MRIVAGELRGRKLISPPGDEVRPTADRVREAVFSILGPGAFDDAIVLDLFAGTGALAIESISRGAPLATLVDTDVRPALRNVEALNLAERAEIIRADALDFLRTGRDRFDLVFCDPPYKLGPRLSKPLAALIPPRMKPGARLVIESPTRQPIEFDSLPQLTSRRYGSTTIAIYEKDHEDEVA